MTGVIIGRFQVPYLHVGHLHLISSALRECDYVVILLGSTKEINEKNPYPFLHRTRMIRKIFPQIDIWNLPDVPGDDESWSTNIDNMIEDLNCPLLFHSRDSFKDHYKGKFPLKEVPEIPGYSGTQLRNQINENPITPPFSLG